MGKKNMMLILWEDVFFCLFSLRIGGGNTPVPLHLRHSFKHTVSFVVCVYEGFKSFFFFLGVCLFFFILHSYHDTENW